MTNEELARDAQRAGDKAASGIHAAAESVANAASSVRQKASDYIGAPAQEFAAAASDRINASADYLRNSDMPRMRSDAETLVRNNPGPAMLVAAVFGFLLGRALTRE